MSDLVLRGVEMPTNRDVIVRIDPNGEVYVYGTYPTLLLRAIPLPEGHGDLIDRDALWENMTVEQSKAFQKGLAGTIDLFEMLETAIPIVPAEGGDADGN